jgi:hypothetical protein
VKHLFLVVWEEESEISCWLVNFIFGLLGGICEKMGGGGGGGGTGVIFLPDCVNN